MSFWYLATPYDAHPGGHELAAEQAAQQAAFLLANNIAIFSPITHTHSISKHVDKPHSFWMDLDRNFMRTAKGLIVCALPGYLESKGIAQEVDYFTKAKKPVVFMNPFVVPAELR